ncbi:hypothetical protein [Oceanobacillus sp. CAU 1775]
MLLLFGGYVVAAIGAALAHYYSKDKSKKRKYKLWGLALIVFSAPLSISMGYTLVFLAQNGWAVGIVFYLFPIGFITGLVMLLVGIFRKEESEEK